MSHVSGLWLTPRPRLFPSNPPLSFVAPSVNLSTPPVNTWLWFVVFLAEKVETCHCLWVKSWFFLDQPKKMRSPAPFLVPDVADTQCKGQVAEDFSATDNHAPWLQSSHGIDTRVTEGGIWSRKIRMVGKVPLYLGWRLYLINYSCWGSFLCVCVCLYIYYTSNIGMESSPSVFRRCLGWCETIAPG